MGDDLSNFIESQKKKLERERIEVQSRTEENLKGSENSQSKTTTKAQEKQTRDSEVENTGLQLGGYEKVQQKLRQERKEEYRKFLAEKNMRSTRKIDNVVSDNDRSSIHSSLVKDSPSNGDYYREQDLLRRPENLFERYEDILKRKRAEERQYRGQYDDPAWLNPDIRSMKLTTPNYKFSSRSDGFLSRRYDDNDEAGYDPRRSKRRNWDDNQRRVRFDDEMDLDDSWLRREARLRRRLMVDDLDDDDDDLLDWVRRRGRRGQRRTSAHEERQKPEPEQPQVMRSQTDSNIRSQSAPLMDGKGLFGGSDDPRISKAKKQEQYKKELQAQMKEQEEMKRRERRARFGGDEQIDNSNSASQVPENRFIPRNEYKDTGQPPLLTQEQVINYGPSSRPPPQSSLYDDPLCYYGNYDVGVPSGPSGEVPLVHGAQFASAVVPGVTVGDLSRAARVSEPVATSEHQALHTSTLVSNPPGGQASFGFSPTVMAGKGGVDTDAQAAKKRAAQQAYQEELKRQMEEKNRRKIKEKKEQERYEMKKEEEIRNYNPWGKGGGGAPIRDTTGQLITNLNLMHKINQEGKIVSPRDAPQTPMEKNFEMNLDLNPVIDAPVASNVASNSATAQYSDVPPKHDAVVKSSPFGRSDPLKETQPGDEIKRTAKVEYQEFLKQQVLEKERKRKEEQERRRREEELEEKRLQDQRRKIQEEFEKEQEAKKRKEEETRRKNAEMQTALEAKKLEAERRKKEMEEKRQAELKRKLEKEVATKRTSTYQETRTNSPPIPTIRKQLQNDGGKNQRTESPPVPAMANKQRQDTRSVSPPRYTDPDPSQEQEHDILSQLTALRQQLKNEENKIKSQINHTNVQRKYSNSKVSAAPVHLKREDNASRRSRRDVNAFERAVAHQGTAANKDQQNFSAAEEFNRMKYEETSSLAGEFRSRFPQPAITNSALDLQQQAYLREQEDKLATLRSDYQQTAVTSNNLQEPSRSGSKTSLLESESQFIAVDDATDSPPVGKMTHTQSRHSTARERRRWKQLEEMAKNPKPYESYKPPTPGGFSLNSVTSFNVDNVAQMNEERLRRLEAMRKDGEKSDPDQVLKRFMNRPLTGASEESLEAETYYRPIN